MYKLKLTVKKVTSIQIRTEHPNGYGWNKRYLQPAAAAKDWASSKRVEWEQKHLPHYSQRHPDHWKIVEAIEQKFYRRSLPIFKAMVAGNKK